MDKISIEEFKKNLSSKTVSELKKIADGYNITYTDKTKKSELVDSIVVESPTIHLELPEDPMFVEKTVDEMLEEADNPLKFHRTIQQKSTKDLGEIMKVNIDLLDDSPMNFFKPLKEKKYNEVKDSINTLGLLTPLLVRVKDSGRFEILAGHNRKNICKDLGWDEIPVIVMDVDDDEAEEIMVDTNVEQREEMSPMEIAKAYAVKHKALGKRQGQRNDINKGTKGKTEDIIAKEYEVSGMTVQRYLRLNNLLPEFQQVVDDGTVKVKSAFDLGLVDQKTQKIILQTVKLEDQDELKAFTKNIVKIKNHLKEDRPLTKQEIKDIIFPTEEVEKDFVLKIKVPADYDQKTKDFIEFKAESDPEFILDIIKSYVKDLKD